jgi:hypothetical protein
MELPIPYNQQNSFRQHWSGFDNSFMPANEMLFNGTQPKSMFSNHDFKNKGGLIHNDVYDNVINEWVREYSIKIDSKDRDYTVFPNPFQYTVDCAPPPSSYIEQDGKLVKLNPTRPFIKGPIEKVRYVRLEMAILPVYYALNSDGTLNFKDKIRNRMYNILDIKEFRHDNKYATSQNLEDSFATLYKDSDVHDQYIHFQAKDRGSGTYYFPPDNLGTIKKMTISIKDPYGDVYKPSVDPKINTPHYCICKSDEEKNDRCFLHSLRHPGNPIYQNHIYLKVGVVEPRINKKEFS